MACDTASTPALRDLRPAASLFLRYLHVNKLVLLLTRLSCPVPELLRRVMGEQVEMPIPKSESTVGRYRADHLRSAKGLVEGSLLSILIWLTLIIVGRLLFS